MAKKRDLKSIAAKTLFGVALILFLAVFILSLYHPSEDQVLGAPDPTDPRCYDIPKLDVIDGKPYNQVCGLFVKKDLTDVKVSLTPEETSCLATRGINSKEIEKGAYELLFEENDLFEKPSNMYHCLNPQRVTFYLKDPILLSILGRAVNAKTNDIKYNSDCDSEYDLDQRTICYGVNAILKGNYSVCKSTKFKREFTGRDMLEAFKRVFGQTDFRDTCFYAYAFAKNDIAVCGSVEDHTTRQLCLGEFIAMKAINNHDKNECKDMYKSSKLGELANINWPLHYTYSQCVYWSDPSASAGIEEIKVPDKS